jgi:hypothetical protein
LKLEHIHFWNIIYRAIIIIASPNAFIQKLSSA